MKPNPRKRTRATAAAAEKRSGVKKGPKEEDEAAIDQLKGLVTSIPADELQDRCWYYGEGGISCVAVWDADSGCFWTVEFAGKSSRSNGDKPRKPLLRREEHVANRKGTFRPIAVLESAGL